MMLPRMAEFEKLPLLSPVAQEEAEDQVEEKEKAWQAAEKRQRRDQEATAYVTAARYTPRLSSPHRSYLRNTAIQ